MDGLQSFPASAANTLVEGYCSDFIQLAASLAQTLEQVSMRNLPLGDSRSSLERVEHGMRELADAIANLLRSADAPRSTPPSRKGPAPRRRPRPSMPRKSLPTRPAAAETGDDCTIQGNTASMPLKTVFQFLSRMRKTGSLEVTIEQEHLSFELTDGCLEATETDRSPSDERIGAVLVARGRVTEAQVETMVRRQREAEGHLGLEMVRARLITKTELQDALEHQARLRIRRVIKARQADYAFHEGHRSPDYGHIRIRLALERPVRKR